MPGPSPFATVLAVLAAIVAAAWGLSTWVTLSPDLTDRLRDDAFYEFVWAANLAHGAGGTVSDGVATSGVQWLWTWLLVPIAWWTGPGPAGVAQVAPMLGLLLHFATAALWLSASRDRVANLCLALCWLGHPLLLREAQNGQETALACLLATALVLSRDKGQARFVLLSVLAALARTELLVLVLTLSLCRDAERPWRAIGTVLLAGVLPVSLNLYFGGGLLPDSAAPMSWLWHENHAAVDDGWVAYLQRLWWYTRPVLLGGPFAAASVFGFGWILFRLVRPWWPKALRALPAVAVGVASALGVHDLATPGWAALLLVLFPANSRRKVPLSLLCVVLGLSAIVVLHWPVRWYPRDYYLAPLVVAAFYAIARSARFRLALFALAVVQVQDSWRIRPEPLAGQAEMSMAAEWLGAPDLLPKGAAVGCFNSGIVTFVEHVRSASQPAERRLVLNLDGVVNRDAFRALRDRRLSAYLDERGVRFLLDNPVQFSLDAGVDHACGRYFGDGFDPERDLVELARFDVPGVPTERGAGDSMRLYWRRGRGERPAPLLAAGELDVSRSPGEVVWGARAGEVLEQRGADGAWRPLARVDVDTVVVIRTTDGAFRPREAFRVVAP